MESRRRVTALRYSILPRAHRARVELGDLWIRKFNWSALNFFPFQPNGAGANQICALLRVWRRHRASMLGITDGVARRPVKSNIDFMDSQPDHPGRALVAKARKYLSGRLDQKVRLTEIAVAMGVSST